MLNGSTIQGLEIYTGFSRAEACESVVTCALLFRLQALLPPHVRERPRGLPAVFAAAEPDGSGLHFWPLVVWPAAEWPHGSVAVRPRESVAERAVAWQPDAPPVSLRWGPRASPCGFGFQHSGYSPKPASPQAVPLPCWRDVHDSPWPAVLPGPDHRQPLFAALPELHCIGRVVSPLPFAPNWAAR